MPEVGTIGHILVTAPPSLFFYKNIGLEMDSKENQDGCEEERKDNHKLALEKEGNHKDARL